MPHLMGDAAEGVGKNSLLPKVIRLETGEDRRSSTEIIRFFEAAAGIIMGALGLHPSEKLRNQYFLQ
jgi:hypothetical protein